MFTIKNLTNEVCLLCEKHEDTAVVKSKTFTGVLCQDHLFAIIKKQTQEEPADPKAKDGWRVEID